MLKFLFLWLSGLKLAQKYYENRLSKIKGCQPYRLKFRFQVQIPTAVNEFTLSVQTHLIDYKLSDDGVSKIETIRLPTEKDIMITC